MASKSSYQAQEKGAEIEELLDAMEKLIERLRAMYEQYFLGISKTAPSHLHTDAERKLRDLTQLQIKNTALRYRFATLSQKFGAYNTYWKRTLRLIEQGKYVRDLQRVGRRAARTGEEIPEEILAAMPKMMRERVQRDRAQVVKVAERQGKLPAADGATGAPGAPADPPHLHRLDASIMDDDVDVDDLFASLTREAEEAVDGATARARQARDSVPPVIRDVGPPTEEPAPGRAAPRPSAPPPVPPRPASTTTPPPRPASTTTPPPRPTSTTTPPPRAGATAPPPFPARPGAAVPRPATAAPSRPIPAARSGAVGPRASALGPPPGMSDDDTRALYTRYLKARELCGESNDGVTYDKLLRTLRAQSTKIMNDRRAKGVEFGVVIKDNKVVLKAKPKV